MAYTYQRDEPRPWERYRRQRSANTLSQGDRQSLLKEIAVGTLGSLQKFANVLDLPASSVREGLATITTGEWHNPFDQWIPGNWTTGEHRITGRDLNRKWGLAGEKDTWGNFFGGLATDIFTDPLLPLTLGLAGAPTKFSLFAKKAGLMPYYRQALNDFKAAHRFKEGSKFPLVGARTAAGQMKPSDLVKAAYNIKGDLALNRRQGTLARLRARAAAKELGYNNLKAFEKAMAEEGVQGMRTWGRYGLPQIARFGADPGKLKMAPGIALGKPSGNFYKTWAAYKDAAAEGIKQLPGFEQVGGRLAALLDARALGAIHQLTRAAARANVDMAAVAAADARAPVSKALTALDTVLQKEAPNLGAREYNVLKEANDDLRTVMEFLDASDVSPAYKETVGGALNYADNLLKEQQRLGVEITAVDDYGQALLSTGKKVGLDPKGTRLAYVARQLTAKLNKVDMENIHTLLKQVDPDMPTSAFHLHMLGRNPLLSDIHGGTAMVDQIIRSKEFKEILNDPKLARLPKNLRRQKELERIQGLLERRFGPKGKNVLPRWYRGPTLAQLLGKKDISAAEKVAKLQDELTGGQMRQWINDTSLGDERVNQLLREKLRKDYDLVPRADWTGRELDLTKNELWTLKHSRYRDMAAFIQGLSPEARELGLFGNFPLHDMEKALMREADAVMHAQLTLNVLGDEAAYFRAGEPGQKAGLSIPEVLKALKMDTPQARENIAKMLKLADPADLDNPAMWTLQHQVSEDLLQYKRLFEGPESSKFFGQIADSFMSVFKANVTAPFPAFHIRNHMSGQIRNAIAGMFDWRSYFDSWKMLYGGEVHDAHKIPAVQQIHQQMLRESPELTKALMADAGGFNNKLGTYYLRMAFYDHQLVGPYGGVPGAPNIDVKNRGATPERAAMQTAAGAGTAGEMTGGLVGRNPYSFWHAMKTYLGRQREEVRDALGEVVMEGGKPVTKPTTTLGIWDNEATWSGTPGIFNFGIPLYGARKLIAKARKATLPAGETLSPRMERWLKEPFRRKLVFARVRGAQDKLLHPEQLAVSEYGPVGGGQLFGHAVEGSNRITPALHLLRQGMDMGTALRRVGEAQIEYANKFYTPFEQQVMRRLVPFYSFTSRSIPWAARRFAEAPGNLLAQIIRGTHRTAEHLGARHQTVGPVPPWIADTLAIPLPHEDKSTKRFFTGMDLMSQDLWQLGMPFLSGKMGEGMFEMASRLNPLLQYLVEATTGTSLWQRSVEEGRPLRTMDPLLGRTIANIHTTWANAFNEPVNYGWIDKLTQPGAAEHLFTKTPLTRYASTLRTLFDPRKGKIAKALRLGMGAGIQDISPQAQETILREYLRHMIGKSGGALFEKATFTKEQLANMNPADRKRALSLKALYDERAAIAKQLRSKANLQYLQSRR